MSYSVTLPAGEVREFETLTDAREFAVKVAKDETIELEVVHVATNAVAYVATYVPAERYFNPWERVESPKFSAPHIEGYRPAYTRKRIEAVVYRALDERSWLVWDGRTAGQRVVTTTREACRLTAAMRQGLHL